MKFRLNKERSVSVLIREREYGEKCYGKTKSITIYEATHKEVVDVIEAAIVKAAKKTS